MIQGRWLENDLQPSENIRKAVFGKDFRESDAMSRYMLVYDDSERPVGTGRLWWQDGAFYLGEVCVLPEERGKRYGDLTVRLLIFKALTHGAVQLRLRPTAETRAFFARYGFRDDPDMPDEMFVPADEVRLSNCHGCANA